MPCGLNFSLAWAVAFFHVLDLLLERKYVTLPEGFVCMELIPHNINIDFVGKRFFFVIFSLIINLLSIVLMLTWGLNYGLDFVGGAMIEVRFTQATTTAEIQKAVTGQDLDDLTIQDVGRDSKIFML